MNAKPKLNLQKLTDTEKASLAVKVGVSLIDHEATFPDAPIAGADLQDAGIAAEVVINAVATQRATLREFNAEQMANIAALEGMLRRTASYVAQVAHGDPAKILLSGLDVGNRPQPITHLHAPAGFTVIPSPNQGRMDLKWTPVKGAKSYTVEYATAATLPTTWPGHLSTTKSKATITGLTTCTRHWFRVAAIGAAGVGPHSDAISMIAQ